MYVLNCNGKLLSLNTPVVMGIINATTDSFFKGDLAGGVEKMTMVATQMLQDGAGIIDIGGQSTRPGSQQITPDEETKRVIPLIKSIRDKHPEAIISIDTYYSAVAIESINAGASVINDISGGEMDSSMLQIAGRLGVPYVCTHMQGIPSTMQLSPTYKNVVEEVLDFLVRKIEQCEKAGIKDVIIDPGFGFGKTTEQNFALLKGISLLAITGRPVLAGLSRKSMIYKTLQVSPQEALNGTTALNMIALLNGASVLRVHDVKEASETIQLYKAYIKRTHL